MRIAILMFMIIGPGIATCGCRASGQTAVQMITLPDGVRLLLKPEPSTAITAVTVFVRTPRDVTVQDSAVGELVAHALFYGSTDRTRDGIALSVAQIGGVLETLRTPDFISIACVTVPEQIEDTARMLGEVLKHADFGLDALDRARQDIQYDRLRRREDGFEVGCEAARAALVDTAIPTDELLKSVTHEQAIRYFQERYVPTSTIVSVAGRFSPRVVETAFRAYLNEYDRLSRVRPDNMRPAAAIVATAGVSGVSHGSDAQPPLAVAHKPQLLALASGNAAYALVGTEAPAIDNLDAPAFQVLQAMLGGGHASRLFRRVRDTLGLGYSVGALYRDELSDALITYIQWDAGRVRAGGTTSVLDPADAIHLLEAQLDGVLADAPDDAEMARARSVAVGRNALRHERVRDRSFMLGWYEAMGLGYAYDAAYPQLLSSVSRADVLRVARRYLTRRCAVIVTPDH